MVADIEADMADKAEGVQVETVRSASHEISDCCYKSPTFPAATWALHADSEPAVHQRA